MKNLINYYYGLNVDNYKKTNENFAFNINDEKYEFSIFDGNLDDLFKNYSIALNNNKYCHKIVFNKNQQILTYYNNKPYILLKKEINITKGIDLNEILNYNLPVYNVNEFNWKKFWKRKIDYYEYQISQLAVKYEKIKESFSYYIGLSETAISLLNFINTSEINYCISHKRINIKDKIDSLFNPINFVVDSRVRDISEYIKMSYFNDQIEKLDIYTIIKKLNLNKTESILFFSRLLYPTYYFDMYDKIIQGKTSEEKINNIIKKNNSYEMFLKKIYKYLNKEYKIPNIEWLNN